MPAKGTPITSSSADVAVIGGGIIGLAVAWRAAQRGLRVTVLDGAEVGAGASSVAAGMLGAVAEAEVADAGRRLLALSLSSAERWPAFAGELWEATGLDAGLRQAGTLV